MKLQSSLLILLLAAGQLAGQQFTKVTSGALVTTPSGSRSANFLDVNRDNFPDILITNGKTGGENNLLYLNDRAGGFTLLADTIGRDGSPTDGATCADFDNDGRVDVYAVNWYNADNLLYQNAGGTGFARLGTGNIAQDGGYSETAAWGDYDQDGLVDLYVTNSAGVRRNFLYRNLGAGAFAKVSGIPPVTDGATSRCVNWIDYDLDGDLDLYVTNENNEPNNLYRNDAGNFVPLTGDPIVSGTFSSHSSSWADYDNDGDLDLLVANYNQRNRLFNNDGQAHFTEVPNPWGTDLGCSFSSSWADYDNDGDLDLFVTNGYCQSNLTNFLYANNGDGTFTKNVTEAMATDLGGSYGCAWGDYNNDGFQDLVVANWQGENQSNSLYRNNGNANHWFKLQLEGTVSNRSAIGAIVRCRAVIGGNPIWQMREVSSQSGYCSQNSLVVHFGLGDAVAVDSLRVIWPSGTVQDFSGLGTDEYFSLEENGGLVLVGREASPTLEVRVVVYPNPSAGEFMLEVAGMSGKRLALEIVNLQGQVVHAEAFGPVRDRARIKPQGWPGRNGAGIYLLRLRERGRVLFQERLVIGH